MKKLLVCLMIMTCLCQPLGQEEPKKIVLESNLPIYTGGGEKLVQ